MRTIVLHGYNVRDGGTGTTDQLRPVLERVGIEVIEADYGYYDLIDVRTRNHNVVRRLVDIARPGDSFIGHSNGCAIAALAIEAGAPFQRGVMIHPALRSHWTPPARHPVESITVYYHWSDYAVWSAALLRLLSPGRFIWGRHIWGAMGATGPLGKDPRMIGRPGAWFHSSGFNNVEGWGARWVGGLRDV